MSPVGEGGYRLAPTKGTVLFSLGPEEVVALLLATRAETGMPFTAAANAATQRLLDALPDPTRVAVEELRGRFRTANVARQRARTAVQRSVEAAVRDRLVVRIRYVDADEVKTNRAVEAHGFYGAVDGWYLVGWCRLRDAGRIFRLDRITRATTTHGIAPTRELDAVLGWVPHDVTRP